MGLDTRPRREPLIVSPSLDQGDLGTQGEPHCRRRGRCRACVPWHLLTMRLELPAHLPLHAPGDQQANDGEHRQSGHPCGFLEPPGRDGRGGLAPPTPRFHGGRLVLIGLENLWSRPLRRAHRRGEYRPAMVCLGMTPPLDLHHQARAGLGRGWGRLRWPSSPGAARAAALCHDARAARVRPPGARPAAAAPLPAALLLGTGGRGIGPAGAPPGVPRPPVGGPGLSGFPWRSGRGRGVRRRQLTRMHPAQAHRFRHDPWLPILDRPLPHDAWPMPTAGRCRRGPPRFLSHPGQGEWLLPPGFAGLP
jgi:hypothetical protein